LSLDDTRWAITNMGDPVPNLARILLVDDDVSLLTLLAMGLKAYGFAVTTAGNGIEALKEYHAHCGNFSSIVTDAHMPQMDGLGFLREVRGIGYKGRVVLMSGHLSVEELRNYAEVNISGFFHKPFEPQMLATMLQA